MERRIAVDKLAEDMLVVVRVVADDRLVPEQVFVDDTLALAQIAVDVAALHEHPSPRKVDLALPGPP